MSWFGLIQDTEDQGQAALRRAASDGACDAKDNNSWFSMREDECPEPKAEGADTDLRSRYKYDGTKLQLATQKGDAGVVAGLLEAGADVNAR